MARPLNIATPDFPTLYAAILDRIETLDPIKYGPTRNFIDGAVSYLSPYISRGVISTKQVFEKVIAQGYSLSAIEKFVQELAWRDYWQQVWIAKGTLIDDDLKQRQNGISNHEMPMGLLRAETGITAIDGAIRGFYESGYLHNHLRMYIASIACNVGQSHWKIPAQWMYYHLLDGDWASNALSWQWVAGSNSNKKYYANQENINKFCYTDQRDTFLDVGYEEFGTLEIPKSLLLTEVPKLKTPLPMQMLPLRIDPELPLLIYNYYNLDPLWKKEIQANRVVLLEPSFFQKYPVSQKAIDFMIALTKNIHKAQLYVGQFQDLIEQYPTTEIYYKEHPTNNHYQGIKESRDWMFEVEGYFPSFFGFWKKCKKQLRYA